MRLEIPIRWMNCTAGPNASAQRAIGVRPQSVRPQSSDAIDHEKLAAGDTRRRGVRFEFRCFREPGEFLGRCGQAGLPREIFPGEKSKSGFHIEQRLAVEKHLHLERYQRHRALTCDVDELGARSDYSMARRDISVDSRRAIQIAEIKFLFR